jgi:hypothetical protein
MARTEFREEFSVFDRAMQSDIAVPYNTEKAAIAARHRLNRARRFYRTSVGATPFDALTLTVEEMDGMWAVKFTRVRPDKVQIIDLATGETEHLKVDDRIEDVDAHIAKLAASMGEETAEMKAARIKAEEDEIEATRGTGLDFD